MVRKPAHQHLHGRGTPGARGEDCAYEGGNGSYPQACVEETDLETFAGLAQDFYEATIPDGYEAYLALQELFEPGTDKRRIVELLMAEEETDPDEFDVQ